MFRCFDSFTETTAGEARADAPSTHVERNANLEHQAAEHAASVAKVYALWSGHLVMVS